MISDERAALLGRAIGGPLRDEAPDPADRVLILGAMACGALCEIPVERRCIAVAAFVGAVMNNTGVADDEAVRAPEGLQ